MRAPPLLADPSRSRAQALCAMVAEGAGPPAWLGAGDPALRGAVREAAAGLAGRPGRVAQVATLGRIPARAVLLAAAAAGPGGAREAAARLALAARDAGLSSMAVAVPNPGAAAEAVEGASMALYEFSRFRAEGPRPAPRLELLGQDTREMRGAAGRGAAVAAGVALARDLANMPPNECPPAGLARMARAALAGSGARVSVKGPRELERGGFGGIAAVGGGSENGPRLITMEYRGAGGASRPVALVGKAVTFDTGGISIKPGEKMEEMKYDKSGGCAVIAAVRTAAALRLPVNVVGIVPAVENMPGGSAYRPGDVVRLYGGNTAEIINTDAEGRLILADAIAYAEQRHRPAEIIDLATLTGACVVALGADVAGLFSSDDGLAGAIAESARRVGEPVWRLPLDDTYMAMIRSEVADMRNMGRGRAAGAIAAAAFLRRAVRDAPWAHLDIAGTAWTQAATTERPYNPKGATGFGVRLLADYLGSRPRARAGRSK